MSHAVSTEHRRTEEVSAKVALRQENKRAFHFAERMMRIRSGASRAGVVSFSHCHTRRTTDHARDRAMLRLLESKSSLLAIESSLWVNDRLVVQQCAGFARRVADLSSALVSDAVLVTPHDPDLVVQKPHALSQLL